MSRLFIISFMLIIALTFNAWTAITFYKMGATEARKQMPAPLVIPPTQETINRQCVDWFFTANFKQVRKDVCKAEKK